MNKNICHITKRILREEYQRLNEIVSDNKEHWFWITPENKILNVYKYGHEQFIKSDVNPNYDGSKESYLNLFKNGWVRVSYEYYPEENEGDLSIKAYDKNRVIAALKYIFKNVINYNNKKIHIDTSSESPTFSTSTSDGKALLFNYMNNKTNVTEQAVIDHYNDSDSKNVATIEPANGKIETAFMILLRFLSYIPSIDDPKERQVRCNFAKQILEQYKDNLHQEVKGEEMFKKFLSEQASIGGVNNTMGEPLMTYSQYQSFRGLEHEQTIDEKDENNEHLQEIIPNQYVYHTSNPIFRKDIAKYGLIPKGKSEAWLSNTPINGKVIFATDSDNKENWFDSTYDDDIYKINTSNLNNKWFLDPNFTWGDYNHIITFDSIPIENIKLIYKGTGESKI